MRSKYFKLAFRIIFFTGCLYCFIVELNALSSFLTGTLLFFYIWLPITVLILLISIIKLINVVKYVKNDFELSKNQNFIERYSNKLVIILISLLILLSLGYSAYQSYHTNHKPYYTVLNSSHFTDYIEDENSKYNIGLMNTVSLFGDTDTTISKMIFIDDTKNQIIIEGCHIETESVLLTNLKYSLVKMRLMKDKNYIEKDNCVYFYEPGAYNRIIKYSKITTIAKGKSGFVYVVVETSTPEVPIDIEKTLSYCNKLVS